MNSVITNPISNIPVNEKSHVHGWTQIWRDQLGSCIDHKCTPKVKSYDRVYIDHGANFGGTLNLFGGATKEVLTVLISLLLVMILFRLIMICRIMAKCLRNVLVLIPHTKA